MADCYFRKKRELLRSTPMPHAQRVLYEKRKLHGEAHYIT